MRLREYLTKKEISQAEFARSIGVTPMAISHYINGEYPSAATMKKIMEATKGLVKANDFFK